MKRLIWMVIGAVVGALGGWGVCRSAPPVFEASTRIGVMETRDGVTPWARDVLPRHVTEFLQHAFSSARLERTIYQERLYESERRTMATAAIVERMRRDIVVQIPRSPIDGTVLSFTIGFKHGDPRTALRVTEWLASFVIDEELAPSPETEGLERRFHVRDGARLPETPTSPRLLPHLAFGALAGIGVGLVFSLIVFLRDRRRAWTQG